MQLEIDSDKDDLLVYRDFLLDQNETNKLAGAEYLLNTDTFPHKENNRLKMWIWGTKMLSYDLPVNTFRSLSDISNELFWNDWNSLLEDIGKVILSLDNPK